MSFLKQLKLPIFRFSLVLRTGSSFSGGSPFWEKKMRLRFEQMDVDKDGVFSDKDIRRITDKFVKFSGNPDTYSMYYHTTSSVWSYGLLKGKEGHANVDQFVEGMKTFVALPDADKVIVNFCNVLFSLADKDGDNALSYDELRDFLSNTTEMNQDMIDMLISQTDTNSDGLIQLSEYQQNLLNFFFKETN